MITLHDFHTDYIQGIISDADARGTSRVESFFQLYCEDLVEIGDLSSNYTVGDISNRSMEMYGYDYDEERRIFTAINIHFFQTDDIKTLTMQQLQANFKKIQRFIKAAKEGLYSELEETSPSHDAAYMLYQYYLVGKIDKFRLMILTDGKVTKNLTEIPADTSDGLVNEYRVIDINYLFKQYAAKREGTSYEIEVSLPCLEVSNNTQEYVAYLSILNGDQLYEIYDEYGQRLLEQNVRTFLQFRGNVNKGIKNTIEYKPELFFAYNNGITATATEVKVENGVIKKIKDFQIVNGGQTTSAIYAAKKVSKLDISNVNVQMKLSVVTDINNRTEFVSKVSEYANTQNKVNKSDFFSNSNFHKEMKQYSSKTWAPAVGGSQQRTKWYYERVRGEYLNEQAYLTVSKKKQFQLEHPKKQVIDKTFLAKSENTWLQKPHIVSKGAQYSFAEFAEKTTVKLEKDKLLVSEQYFKEAVAKILIFRATETVISKADWYENAYRAQTVAYTLSYLSYWLEKNKLWLNFDLIWEQQVVPFEFINVLKVITKNVYDMIMNPPVGAKNVGEWCKKESCWNYIKHTNIEFQIDAKLLKTQNEYMERVKSEKALKEMDVGINAEIQVYNIPIEEWIGLYGYYSKAENGRSISVAQRDILKKYSMQNIQFPTEKQCKILMNVYKKAVDEGWSI